MKNIIIALTLAGSVFPTVLAQENNNNNTSQTTNNRFWEAKLPNGDYMVALSKISSISKHSYYVGGIEVTEVVVDTNGNALARFYVFGAAGEDSDANIGKNTIDRAKELMELGGERTGTNPNAVTKTYPHTTHAKTVEFRLSNKSAINALYSSVKRAWERNRGTKFTSR